MLVLAHRGAARAARENTAEAFLLATQMGADGIELDVRRSHDGRLLIHHDPLPSPLPTGAEALLDLDGALEACAGVGVVNIELKNTADDPDHDPSMAIVIDTIAALRRERDARADHGVTAAADSSAAAGADRWLVSSFSRATIDVCKDVAPEIPTTWLVFDMSGVDVRELAGAGHRAVHPWDPTVTAAGVDDAHAAGLAVNVWTCNEPDRLLELAAMGVDGVCTDVPDLALRVLGRR